MELTEQSRKLLEDYYMLPDEKDPSESFKRAADAFSGGNPELANMIYYYVEKGWFMFSSPILSNAPSSNPNIKSNKGMPISCFLGYVDDSLEGLIGHSSEMRWLSVKGGGTGAHWSDVRTISDIAPGPIPFLHTMDADMTAYKQGKTRKGSYAAYLDISHPDIREFLGIRIPTGDVGRKCLNIHHGVNISDEFMKAVEENNEWLLIDPNTKKVIEMVKARELWEALLETRYRTGEPYLYFIDTANKAYPETQKELGLKSNGSNLCAEITLPTNTERTAVCCLSSVNLEKWDEWKDTTMVADLITFLDNVIEYFVQNAPDEISKARYSASQERSLGLGAMGFHNLLMSKNIPFDSPEAEVINEEIFEKIKRQANIQSNVLGVQRGEAPDMVGTSRRNANLLAIAPNANSSAIAGTSPSIEPIKANAYIHRTRAGTHVIKNKVLSRLLARKDKDNEETWNKILSDNGSVRSLDFLTPHEKNVFKTAIEINQLSLVRLAGQRQKHVCQSQSLNIFFPAGIDKKYLHDVHLEAWKVGCKSLYYLRTETSNKAETLDKVKRDTLKDFKGDIDEDCAGCQA